MDQPENNVVDLTALMSAIRESEFKVMTEFAPNWQQILTAEHQQYQLRDEYRSVGRRLADECFTIQRDETDASGKRTVVSSMVVMKTELALEILYALHMLRRKFGPRIVLMPDHVAPKVDRSPGEI